MVTGPDGDEVAAGRVGAAPRRGAVKLSTTGEPSTISSSLHPAARPSCSARTAIAAPESPSWALRSIPVNTSYAWVVASSRRVRSSRSTRSPSASSSRRGIIARSRSTVATASCANLGRAMRRRPTRHAVPNRRTIAAGLMRRRSVVRASTAPMSSRSTATQPPTVVTTGERSMERFGTAPVVRNARTMPSRRGGIQRSCSSGRSGAGNVSANGPGPSSTELRPSAGAIAVTGRLCRSQRRSAGSTSHSMSCGAPKTCSARRAIRARARRRARSSGGMCPVCVTRTIRSPTGQHVVIGHRRAAHERVRDPMARPRRRSGRGSP